MKDNEAAGTEESNLTGLGGWLGLLLIGLVFSTASLLLAFFTNFNNGQYAELYGNNWLVPTFIIWDSTYFSIFGWSTYLLIKRKRLAIRVITHALWTFAVINLFLVNAQMIDARNAVDAGLITQSIADDWTSSIGSDAGRAIIAALIWIPYLIRSKRVRLTLIN